jgi:hypothetical protein
MAAKSSSNGSKLEEAMALLINNQAAFVAGQREHERDIAGLRREMAEIKSQLAVIVQVLERHGRMLERLPDAVRDRIGFKPE